MARSEECYNAVLTALEAGYRHFDSAAWYGNEADVGRAVTKWIQTTGGKREDVLSYLEVDLIGRSFSLLNSVIRIMGMKRPRLPSMSLSRNGVTATSICI